MTKWAVATAPRKGWALTQPPGPVARAGAPSVGWRDRTGMSVHLTGAGQTEANRICAKAASMGARWIRDDLSMHLVNPARGTFDWTATDTTFTAAANNGLQVLGILDYSATWANGAADLFHPPLDLADWVTYALAVIARYGSGGTFWRDNPTVPKIPLGAVELWNEPWNSHFWLPDIDPVGYAALVRAAAPAIRQADPTVKIVASVDLIGWHTDTSQTEFGTAVIAADPGIPDLVDAWGVHLYIDPRTFGAYSGYFNWRVAPQRFWTIRDDMAHLGASKPIWVTEIGWKTVATDSLTEAQAATNYTDILKRCFEEWGAAKCFLYFLGNRDAADDNLAYGMLTETGAETAAVPAIRSYLAAA